VAKSRLLPDDGVCGSYPKANSGSIAEGLGAIAIDYKSVSVEEYVATQTSGKGIDIILDTVGGATLDASFAAVKRYTGHVVCILGW
jgi:NADPH:quinone reductase